VGGNSLAVRIPKPLWLKMLKVEKNGFELIRGKVIATPAKNKNLQQMLANDEKKSEEVESGAPGRTGIW
jgi:antitoxin component of MazEF toxin-antitoxin module